MGKKKPARGNLGKKKRKEQEDIDRLIRSVTDSEVINFKCEIPSDEELNGLNFPNVVVNPPSLQYLSRNVTKGDWAAEWLTLLISKEETLGLDFSKLSEEEQKMHRDEMVEVVRKSRRSLKWKKYQYALRKKSESGAALSWEGEWDDDHEWGASGSGVGISI